MMIIVMGEFAVVRLSLGCQKTSIGGITYRMR